MNKSINKLSISSITAGPRESNFELLRIIAMFLVLTVHADFWSLGEPSSEEFMTNPWNAFTRTFIESLSIVCVNIFILISGWFGIKPTFRGLSNFLFQCAFFLFTIYGVMLLTGLTELSLKGIAGCFCLTQANWFIRAYIGLYILSPILNIFIEKAPKRTIEIFIIAFFLFQTIWGWSGAAKFVEQGYSTFSFIGLYILSRYMNHNRIRSITNWGGRIYVAAVIINTLVYYLLRRFDFHSGVVFSYVNPVVILGSLGLLVWFSKLSIKHNKIINWIARSSFGVFLIHTNPNIGEPIYKVLMINLYNSYNGFLCLIAMFIALMGVYAIGTLYDQPRKWLWKIITFRFFPSGK